MLVGAVITCHSERSEGSIILYRTSMIISMKKAFKIREFLNLNAYNV